MMDITFKDYADNVRAFYTNFEKGGHREEWLESVIKTFNACCDANYYPLKSYYKAQKDGTMLIYTVGQKMENEARKQ